MTLQHLLTSLPLFNLSTFLRCHPDARHRTSGTYIQHKKFNLLTDNPIAQGDSRGWYKPEGYAAFLAEIPMPSSGIRDADASRWALIKFYDIVPLHFGAARYHARTWIHSGEPDPDRSWYKPRAKSEKPCIVSHKVVSVASETKVSGHTLSIARRFYNALKRYLTWMTQNLRHFHSFPLMWRHSGPFAQIDGHDRVQLFVHLDSKVFLLVSSL